MGHPYRFETIGDIKAHYWFSLEIIKSGVRKACESGFPYHFLTDFTKYFVEVCCLFLASSQGKLFKYNEYFKFDVTMKKN